jgi:hypothetical protein
VAAGWKVTIIERNLFRLRLRRGPENPPGVGELEVQVTQSWVVIGAPPDRPVIFAI